MEGKPEHGFGGWVDQKIETGREAAPLSRREETLSTTVDSSFPTRLQNVIPAKAGIQT